jgi:hypothetical protein
MRIVDALHAAHPRVSYDVTIKVEHLLRHRDLLPRLAETGCLFVTSAVESIRRSGVDAARERAHARRLCRGGPLTRRAGVTLVPTFVAFHPWLTLQGYCDLLDTIAALDLVDHVAPIQLAIRLLLPEGSPLLARDEMRRHVGEFDAATLCLPVDASRSARRPAATRSDGDRRREAERGSARGLRGSGGARLPVRWPAVRLTQTCPRPRDGAYLNEPWYC